MADNSIFYIRTYTVRGKFRVLLITLIFSNEVVAKRKVVN